MKVERSRTYHRHEDASDATVSSLAAPEAFLLLPPQDMEPVQPKSSLEVESAGAGVPMNRTANGTVTDATRMRLGLEFESETKTSEEAEGIRSHVRALFEAIFGERCLVVPAPEADRVLHVVEIQLGIHPVGGSFGRAYECVCVRLDGYWRPGVAVDEDGTSSEASRGEAQEEIELRTRLVREAFADLFVKLRRALDAPVLGVEELLRS